MLRYRLGAALVLAFVASLALPSPTEAYGDEVVCYFSSWARWRPGEGMFDVENIDPFLCTNLVFAFTGLSNQTWELEVLDPWNELCPSEPDGHYCAFDRFVALKKINPNLKTLLAVGGWREGSEDYSVMAADPAKRKSFIDSSIARIRKHGFDGFDVDWEYPSNRGGEPEDKENFVQLMKELRDEFDKINPPLLLTFATAAGKTNIDTAYDVTRLSTLIDRWHVMAYDYHGAWENFTHHVAPLCGYYLDGEEFLTFNVRFTAHYYLDLGVPKDKMVLGIATYGRCWTLDDVDDHGVYAPAHAPGPAGPYIQIPGTLGFNEICEKLTAADSDCTVVRDPHLFEPYFYCHSDKVWCGYDDEDSVYLKARYAKNLGLAGIMVWQIDTDDFHPLCYSEPFHLIHQMKRAVEEPAGGDELVCPDYYGSTVIEASSFVSSSAAIKTTTDTNTGTSIITTSIQTATATIPATTTDIPNTTTNNTNLSTTSPFIGTTTSPNSGTSHDPNTRPDCSELPDGTTFPHTDCDKYWECASGHATLEPCGPGTVWDDINKICNWEDQVDTSYCNQWICSIDNTYYPHVNCNQYYWCYQGSPHVETCPSGTYWSQDITECVNLTDADTSLCNME